MANAPHITKNGIAIEAPLKDAKVIGKVIADCRTLDAVRRTLATPGCAFDDWFVYQGGNHVALHRHHGARRFALITKATQS